MTSSLYIYIYLSIYIYILHIKATSREGLYGELGSLGLLKKRWRNELFCLYKIVNRLLRISPYSVRMWENTDQKNFRIRTLFTQYKTMSKCMFIKMTKF